MGPEEGHVGLVDRGELGGIGHEHRRLDHVPEGGAVVAEQSLSVGQGLGELGRGAPIHQHRCGGDPTSRAGAAGRRLVQAELPRADEPGPGPHDRGVGADGRDRCGHRVLLTGWWLGVQGSGFRVQLRVRLRIGPGSPIRTGSRGHPVRGIGQFIGCSRYVRATSPSFRGGQAAEPLRCVAWGGASVPGGGSGFARADGCRVCGEWPVHGGRLRSSWQAHPRAAGDGLELPHHYGLAAGDRAGRRAGDARSRSDRRSGPRPPSALLQGRRGTL